MLNACPHAPEFTWDWAGVMNTPVGALLSKMEEIPQDPLWHGEGSAGQHTRLVCEALSAGSAFLIHHPDGHTQAADTIESLLQQLSV